MAAFSAFVALALASPFIILGFALVRALVLFWPVMILLGMAHAQIPGIPALGWWPTLVVVALLGLLIPTSTNTSTTS
jgi:O-antigen ligase